MACTLYMPAVLSLSSTVETVPTIEADVLDRRSSSLSRDWAGLGLSVGMGRGATSAMWSNRLLSYLSLMWY